MDLELRRALEPVLRDLRATAGPLPTRMEDDAWAGTDSASAVFRGSDGSGIGVRVSRAEPLVDQVVQATDQVQEWAVEELWRSAPTNWPPCPRHPTTHPLQVRVHGRAAWWTCPRDGVPVTEVGALG